MMVGWEGTANDSRIFLDTTTEPENGHYRHRENTILWTQALRLCLKVFLLTVGSGTTCVILEKKAVLASKRLKGSDQGNEHFAL